MASITKYIADGTTREFNISFDYISTSDVVVKVAGQSVGYNFISDSTVLLDITPTAGTLVVIKRETSKAPLVDFTDGSTLYEADLDLAAKQGRFLAEEAFDQTDQSLKLDEVDGVFDARGLRIKNIATPVDDDEIATKGFVNNTGQSVLAYAQSVKDELYGLTTNVERLPYGSSGYSNYDAATGHLNIFLSEGPQGVQGVAGPVGPVGAQGPIGTEGPRGPQGPTGATGATGPLGPTGLQGVDGLQGPKGDQGERGPTGATGPMGPRGLQGVTGEQGATGPVGQIGATGPVGPEGPQGIQGPVGPLGNKGPTGDMGATPLGLAFGNFYLNDEGELMIEYYGDADTNDFRIDAEGFLYVTTV